MEGQSEGYKNWHLEYLEFSLYAICVKKVFVGLETDRGTSDF